VVIQPLGEYHAKILAAISEGNARLHFSQIGEDGVIWELYKEVYDGFYVDIGCHHPFRYSNTALLHLFNRWKGLNVDADQRAIDLFRQHRPLDINVRCAIGNRAGMIEAFVFRDGAVNTVDPSWAERQVKDYGEPERQVVEVLPTRELLDRHLPPGTAIDLMNIDIEGFDQEAIESNDWQRYRPKMICIETHGFNINSPSDNPTFRFMRSVDYHMIAHVYATSIYVADR
jgi:FkbM family methyltransferase